MGLWQNIRSAFSREQIEQPADTVAPEDRAATSFMERALVGGDMGVTAVSMSSSQAPQRRGNMEAMRSYRTGPWVRGAFGRVSGSVAAVRWKLYASPQPGQYTLKRVDFEEMHRIGLRMRMPPGDLLEMSGQLRAKHVRTLVNDGELVEITRHPFCRLMSEPNAFMTGRVARQVTQASIDLCGDAGWVLGGPSGGKPTHAWPVPGIWIQRRPTIEEPWWVIQIGSGSMGSGSGTWNVPWDAFLLFNDPDPMNPYGAGVGLGYTLGDEVDIDESAAKTVSAFFHNNAMPAVLASIKGAKRDQLERTKREWNNHLQGFKKAYKAHFTGGEIDVKRLDTSFADMQLVELRKAQRDIFQQVIGIPAEILGINESSNRATSEAAQAIMAQHVVIPRCETMREQFQKLAHMYDNRLVVEYEDPTPVNLENRRTVMVALPHLFRVDEIRELADEDPTGDADGRGYVDRDGIWWGSLSAKGPKTEPFDYAGGTLTLNERREYLRLSAVPGPDGDKPTPRTVPPPPPTFGGGFGGPPSNFGSLGEEPKEGEEKPELEQPAVRALPEGGQEKSHLTPADLRQLAEAVDTATMFSALEPAVRSLINEYGQATMESIEVEQGFDDDTAKVRRHIRELGTKRVQKLINPTTRERLKEAVTTAEREWHAGQTVRANIPLPSSFIEAIARAIETVFEEAAGVRAPAIGVTESTLHSGFATTTALTQAPVEVQKEWIATMDDRVRDAHAIMDGQRQNPEDPFVVPGGEWAGQQCDGPGGFGIGALDINCRCVVGTVVLDLHPNEEGGQPETRGLLIGKRMVAPGSDQETRAAAWRAADEDLKQWDARIARAAREGFDRQQVRVLSVLQDLLG